MLGYGRDVCAESLGHASFSWLVPLDDETQRALIGLTERMGQIESRVRFFADQHNHEWRDGAAWRTHWSAELDALIVEVALIQAVIGSLEARVNNDDIERATTAPADMLKAGLEQFLRDVTKRVRDLLAKDRKTILKELDEVRDIAAAVATELASQRTELRAGILGLSQQLSEYEARLRVYEEKQVGAADRASGGTQQ